jgi:hypothetical protein
MRVPESVRKRFREYGKAGGKARARKLTPEARRRIACNAAVERWMRERFGVAKFSELRLPGGDIVDQGLVDLAAGNETVESFLVSIAAARLRRDGVPLPTARLSEPGPRLYRLLSQTEGELAHTRYLAYLRRIVSFADACREVRRRAE